MQQKPVEISKSKDTAAAKSKKRQNWKNKQSENAESSSTITQPTMGNIWKFLRKIDSRISNLERINNQHTKSKQLRNVNGVLEHCINEK